MQVETGERQWLYEWDRYRGFLVPDPVLIDGRVFISTDLAPSADRACALLRIQNGKPVVLFKTAELCSDIGSPVVVNGFIYACHGEPNYNTAYLRCLNLETGELKWEERLSSGTGADSLSLICANGKLIILNEKGILMIAEASPEKYREISRGDVLLGKKRSRRFWMPPVLSGGRVFCRNLAGELICVDMRL